MKVISSLIAIAALSSCVAKPWMVGSVNDHYTMHSYEAGRPIKLAPLTGATGAPAAHSGKEVKKMKNKPVGHTGSNPLN